MRMKRFFSLLLAAVCLSGCLLVPAAAAQPLPMKPVRAYTPDRFQDVALAAWYTPYVATAYELGLMEGPADDAFCPGGDVTIAETIALAARLHKAYNTGDADFEEGSPWYRVYVEYAKDNGILTDSYQDYSGVAYRSEFAQLLSRAFPAAALEKRNEIADDAIPDVPMTADYAAGVYLLYRAGVLTGSDDYGTFLPDTTIRRSEVAAIVSRMAMPALRESYTLRVRHSYPDLELQPKQDDSYFADAAMLGNSLVDGMKLYSGFPVAYYGGTGHTVFNNRVNELIQHQYGKVYIELGVNEIGTSLETFKSSYRSIIEKIQTAMPDAEIYVMSLTPVTLNRHNGGTFAMNRLDEVNHVLYDLAKEMNCWYLDCFTTLCDSTGYLPESYGGWDGSPHLSTAGYKAWADVIRTHYA